MIQTKTIHPLPPAGYSPLSQGESQLLPTQWPHRTYILLPSLVEGQGGGSVGVLRGLLLGEGLEVSGERTRLLMQNKMAPRNVMPSCFICADRAFLSSSVLSPFLPQGFYFITGRIGWPVLRP